MKNATKGALAAAAAGSLLLGGAGSLAYWTGTGEVTGTSINSGKLTMSAPDCVDDAVSADDNGAHEWEYANHDSFTGEVAPGDVISKVCYFTLTQSGSRINATLAVSGGALTQHPGDTGTGTTLHTELKPTAVFKEGSTVISNGVAVGAGATHVYQATVTVTFPYDNPVADNPLTTGVDESVPGSTNTSQDETVDLSNVVLTATQTNPNS